MGFDFANCVFEFSRQRTKMGEINQPENHLLLKRIIQKVTQCLRSHVE